MGTRVRIGAIAALAILAASVLTPAWSMNDVSPQTDALGNPYYTRGLAMMHPIRYGFDTSLWPVPAAFQTDIEWAANHWGKDNVDWENQPRFAYEENPLKQHLVIEYRTDYTTSDPGGVAFRPEIGDDPHNSGWKLVQCIHLIRSCFIHINASIPWHTGSGVPPSTKYDFRSIAAHEMGHIFGLSHSGGSNQVQPYIDPALWDTKPIMRAGLPKATRRRVMSKDDCSGALFLTRNSANCNPWMGINEQVFNYGAEDDDAAFYRIRGRDASGGDFQTCGSFGGLTSACHQRLKSGSGQGWGDYELQYWLGGSRATGDSKDDAAQVNTLRAGQAFRGRVRIGTPNTNTDFAVARICLYLYVNGANPQPYKSGEQCSSHTQSYHSPGTAYFWLETPWYTLPASVGTSQYLLVYVGVTNQQWVAIRDFEIQRSY